MILTYYGHSFFSLELADRRVIAFDPYGHDFNQYPNRTVQADYCLISHHHFDHDGTVAVSKDARVLDECKTYHLGKDLCVRGVPLFHDEVGGQKRGPNTLFVVEAENLRVAHAGDLGHVPNADQLKQIGPVDILMMPVGGFYTANLPDTLETIRLIAPRIVIPMHYRTDYNPDMPIAPLSDFLAAVGAPDTRLPLLRVTAEDLSERPAVLTMAIV